MDGHYFFDIPKDATKLSQTDADLFYHFLVQLFYLSNMELLDIQLAVSFLFNRVIDPDFDYYKNLERVIKYIQDTLSLPLIL